MQPKNIYFYKPSVSIIIPTYNRNETLKRAIHSALNQTIEAIEIIVIDDASAVSPEKIVSSFYDSRIKYINHKFNKGGAAARNTGIIASKGKYIAFLDSDDEWLPKKLEHQIKRLEAESHNVGAHYCGYETISFEGAVLGSRLPMPTENFNHRLYAENIIGPLSGVVVRRKALDDCGLFDESLPSCQDWDLYIRIAQQFVFIFSPQVLFKYHLSKNSITQNFLAKAGGHAIILKKYGQHIIQNKSAYSRQLAVIAHYLCRSGKIRSGRKKYFSAIRCNPFSVSVYIYLLCSFLGFKNYNRIINLRKMF